MPKIFLLLLFCGLAHAQALSGRVSSAEEGAMEGVLVSAKAAGSSATITVVSDAQGRYSFPASRLQPGTYSLGIRAVGYVLNGPATATVLPQETTIDLKLAKASNLAAQLSNAEWIASVPGTHSQKRTLLNCVGCHTLERVVRSTHDSAGFVQTLQRMAGYANQSTALRPQRRLADRDRELIGEERARFHREQNLWAGMMYQGAIAKLDRKSGQLQLWSIPPELNKANTQINMTSPLHFAVDGKMWTQNNGFAAVHRIDLASGKWETFEPFKDSKRNHNIYDVIADSKNNVYFTDFANEHIGRIDAKSGKITLYPTPTPGSSPRRGMMDAQDRLWFAEYRGNRIGLFDPATERFQEWEAPTAWSAPYDIALDRNGEAWTGSMLSDRVLRLVPKSGRFVVYLLPMPTNIRRVFVDSSATPVAVWVGG